MKMKEERVENESIKKYVNECDRVSPAPMTSRRTYHHIKKEETKE